MTALFIPLGVILVASLIALSSISTHLFLLQLGWIAAGAAIIFLFHKIDWKSLLNYQWVIWGVYGLSVLLLAFVDIHGTTIRNVKSWFVFGPINYQPVELAKIGLILVYALYFSKRHLLIAHFRHIFFSFLIFILPMGLVILQPDLGSAAILFGIWFGFLLISGLPRKWITLALLGMILVAFLGWNYVLKDYQKQRITGFLYPEKNALGINYNVNQSKIAIGSAGLWGKGYGQGTQTQLGFLPEPAADFILGAFIEEWGVAAGVAIVAAFLFLVSQILKIAVFTDQNFEKFICIGAAIMLMMQFLLNTGSTTGLLPVVGVPFPFLSYGGSNLLTNFFLLSIINAIARRT